MLVRLTVCAFIALAMSACAPSGGDGEDRPRNAPFGYEFAQFGGSDAGEEIG